MQSQVLNCAYTPTQLPQGEDLSSISVVLQTSAGADQPPFSVNPGDPTVTVQVDPDTYTYTILNKDKAGNTLVGPFTGTFVVSAPTTVTLNLLTGLSV